MTPVFADMFYYLALANPNDAAHASTVAFAQATNRPMLTTDWIITELADALCAVKNRLIFQKLLRILRGPSTTMVPFSADLMERGLTRFSSRLDKDWPLTDCISFVVMEDRAITEALTGDRHFEQAGFRALLKP